MEKLLTPEKETSTEENDLINKVVELIKKEGIGQVVIHGKDIYKEGKKTEDLAFHSDLDTRMALALLNDPNINIISSDKLYTEGATTSVIPMGGSEKNLDYKNPKGVRIFVDVGGEWMKVEEEDGKTTTIFIDHHGSGKKEPTSAAKMTYDIMDKSGLLKEKPEWLKDCVKFVNDFDNLSYVEKKDVKGDKIFSDKYFKYTWPRTLYALADTIPFETLIELKKSGKIGDMSKPFTRNEIEGEIGNIIIDTKDQNGNTVKKTIKEICIEKQKQAIHNSLAIKRGQSYADKKGYNLNTKTFGKLALHDYPKVLNRNGKEYPNKIIDKIAYLAAKAQGCEGIIIWNPKKLDKRFFVNVNSAEMERVGKELLALAPGTTEVRATFIFAPKDPENAKNITKEQFLDIIDPCIQKNMAINSDTKNAKETYVLTEKEKIEAEREEQIEGGNELLDETEDNKEEQLETKVGEAVDTKKVAEEAKNNPELNPKETPKKEVVVKAPVKTEPTKEEKEEIIKKEKELQTNLDTARNKYAEAYKKFMAERKKKAGFFTNLKRKVFGGTVKEEDIPENLKMLEAEYDDAAALYGQNMYKSMENTLNYSEKSATVIKAKLNLYKQKEIFKTVIIDEQEKLQALKAENLPPKEKSLLRKGLDWYLKQPRWKKVLISTVVSTVFMATFLSGTVVAAGGIGAMALTRATRGLTGSIVGQTAAKAYDWLFKDKSGEIREIEEMDLSKDFSKNLFSDDFSFSDMKKGYEEITEKEKKTKRSRLMKKAVITTAVGGLASFEMGHLVHNFPASQVFSGHDADLTKIPGGIKSSAPEHLFKAEGVQFSSRGAIQTIQDLKIKIHADYPDISKAPHSVQEFMKTNSTQEAIRLGFYNPNSAAESAMQLKGSTIGFDEHGNLLNHDVRTGTSRILIHENGNTEDITKYDGKMFDSDHSGERVSLGNIKPGEHITNIDGALDHSGHITNIDNSLNNLNGNHITNIDGSLNNLNGNHITNIDNALNNKIDPSQGLNRFGHFEFKNSDHVVTLDENGSSLKMQFLYDKNGNVSNVDVSGNYNSVEVNQYALEGEIQKLGDFTQVDAHKDIFEMAYQAKFLSKLPPNTLEYKFLHEHIAEMQKNIIDNYGHVLNPQKLEGSFYSINNPASGNLDLSHNLTPEQLAELTVKAHSVYETNIHHIFPDEKSIQAWNNIKSSSDLHPAKQFLSWKGPIAEPYEKILSHMQKLQEVTKLPPIESATIPPIPETPEEYIIRATQKAAEMGPEYLEKVKI